MTIKGDFSSSSLTTQELFRQLQAKVQDLHFSKITTMMRSNIAPAREPQVIDPRVPIDSRIRLSGELVGLQIGAQKSFFHLHENLLSESSAYFRERISEPRAENTPIEIEHLDPVAFGLYVQFLYTRTIPCKELHPADKEWWQKKEEEMDSLIKLYSLATIVEDKTAKNAAITAILSQCNDDRDRNGTTFYPTPQNVELVYRLTEEDAKLRLMVVDFFKAAMSPMWIDGKNYPREFVEDLAKATLASLRRYVREEERWLPTESVCEYHEHEGKICSVRGGRGLGNLKEQDLRVEKRREDSEVAPKTWSFERLGRKDSAVTVEKRKGREVGFGETMVIDLDAEDDENEDEDEDSPNKGRRKPS